jgi:hypothetical protein
VLGSFSPCNVQYPSIHRVTFVQYELETQQRYRSSCVHFQESQPPTPTTTLHACTVRPPKFQKHVLQECRTASESMSVKKHDWRRYIGLQIPAASRSAQRDTSPESSPRNPGSHAGRHRKTSCSRHLHLPEAGSRAPGAQMAAVLADLRRERRPRRGAPPL